MTKKNDLGVKIGNKKEVLWTGVRDEATALIEQSFNHLEIQKELLIIAEKKIKEAKADFKRK